MTTNWLERLAMRHLRRGPGLRYVLGTLAAVGLFAAPDFNASAAATGMISNALMSLNDTTFVNETSEFVTLLGHLHVQTNALADGSVDVQANVSDQILAFSADVQNPTSERRQRLLELRQQAVELLHQMQAIQLELGELRSALDDELNRLVRKRLEELIARADRRLQELARELEQVLAAIRSLLEEIGQEENRDPLYSLVGVQRSLITCAPTIPCSAYLLYPLAHAVQGSASLPIQMTLLFSSRGRLVSAVADTDHE